MPINYRVISQQNYVNSVLDLISYTEGHISRVRDIQDGKATIGYGYTFNRSNNLALWSASESH